jgi:hypothetical protein
MASPASGHQRAASRLSIVIDHASHGRRVALCCPPGANGECTCGGKWDDKAKELVPHTSKEVGKAPVGRFFPKGINDATTNTAQLDRFVREMPEANVSVELQSARWLIVDTDSPETEAAEQAHGLDGAVVRESRNRAYVFERPADCPIINLIKADGDPLDILTFGNFLVHGTHQTGAPIRLDPHAKPGLAPARYVEMLQRKAAENAATAAMLDAKRAEWAAQYGDGPEPPVRLHQRGQRRWRGELVEQNKNGDIDRDLSLWYVGLDLAECGAAKGAVVDALKAIDIHLGWEKFTARRDDREYVKIAEKVVASAIEKEQAPSLKIGQYDAEGHQAAPGEPQTYEDAMAEVFRLRRALLDRDDRLDVLEAVVHGIDDILGRPDEELSAVDKVVAIGVGRWLPSYRSKAEANDKPATVALGYVAKVVGLSPRRVSQSLDRQSSDDPEAGAAFRKRVTRERIADPAGGPDTFVSTLEVIPWKKSTRETLAAAATYRLPERPRPGGSAAATEKRWRRCSDHEDVDVIIRGFCAECGEMIGEQRVAQEDIERLKVQDVLSERQPEKSVDGYLVGGDFGHSALHGRQEIQVVDSDLMRASAMVSTPEPVRFSAGHANRQPAANLGPIKMSDRRAGLFDLDLDAPHTLSVDVGTGDDPLPVRCSPWRCHCGSFEGRPVLNGYQWRCDGCGDVAGLPAAVAGAER